MHATVLQGQTSLIPVLLSLINYYLYTKPAFTDLFISCGFSRQTMFASIGRIEPLEHLRITENIVKVRI